MKTYRVNFKDGYADRDYIIAAANIGDAYALAMANETGTLLDGTVVRPSLECFAATCIDGVYATKAGIKAKYDR